MPLHDAAAMPATCCHYVILFATLPAADADDTRRRHAMLRIQRHQVYIGRRLLMLAQPLSIAMIFDAALRCRGACLLLPLSLMPHATTLR